MNLKELQQKINELVQQGHGDDAVCILNTYTHKYDSNIRICTKKMLRKTEAGNDIESYTIIEI